MSTDSAVGTGSLNRRMTRGAAWMIGLRFVDRVIGLLSTIILARLLIPADFGLVALAMAVVAAIALFGEFGFEMALIQNQTADRRHYDTAWTFGLARGLIASAIVAALAEPLASVFGDPRLGDIVLLLALVPFLEGFYNIGTVAFRKDLTLNKEFVFRIVPRIAGAVTTIAFAFAWRNYWALVYGTLAGVLLRLVMSYVMQSYRPRLSIAAWREIMGFSKWMLVTSIAAFANRKGTTFIIAKFLDAAALGTFSLSAQIANMASAELIAPIKQVLFPGYAKLAHDIAALRKAFLDAYGILVLIALPAAIGIGLTAEYYVPILLGPRWSDTVPLIEILVISGGLRSLSSHARPVYLAMNRPVYGAYASTGAAIFFLPVLFYGVVHYGVLGAAVAHAIGQVAVFFGSLFLMRRIIGLTLGDLVKACWRPFTGCALLILAVCAVKWFPPLDGRTFVDRVALLTAAVLAGFLTYMASVLLLWWVCGRPSDSAESHLLTYVRRVRRRNR